MNRVVKIIRKIVPGIALSLIVIELLVTNELAGLADDVRSMETSLYLLEEQNDYLAAEVASASALSTIATKAQDVGFRKPLNSQYLAVGQEYVVLLPGQSGQPR